MCSKGQPVMKLASADTSQTCSLFAFEALCDIRSRRSVGLERVISLEKLQSVYERPISKAAAHLNIGITVLKKYCRWYSIERWPYRKIHSIDKLMDQLNELEANDVVDKVRISELAGTSNCRLT